MRVLILCFSFLFFNLAQADFHLKINNNTDTGFNAITVGGQWLGHVKQGEQGAQLQVPFVPSFPTYAIILEGDNLHNGAIVNDGSGPYCPGQVTYHNCQFTNVNLDHATVTINQ